MTVFIAFLRGINVGGKNKIKMTDLKRLCEAIGLFRVETYIQSGNILFESNETEDVLRTKIELAIQNEFGFSVPVVLRTAAELETLIAGCPFSDEEIADAQSYNTEGESCYVHLMASAPAPEKLESLEKWRREADDFRVTGRDMYILLRHSIRHSKLANNIQKPDMRGTVRNFKTLNAVAALARVRAID